ncbi:MULTISPECIES: Hint domain-containing protein [unclassified Ruegeria]|uniref:Hint domain-containing protein n=1 Tax=unclassified Ruegeria TaxID=2625375 RepID=UPI001488A9AA|nr:MULTISPECIES: Hint domain-containing protein [unclassified Ruegeria]
MGFIFYNISEVTGFTGSGTANLDIWTTSADLSDPSVTTVTGDFDLDNNLDGVGGSEAQDGYVFNLPVTPYGTFVTNSTTGEFTFIIDRAAVIASGSDQVVSFTVTGSDASGASDTDTVVINLLICVSRGTLIATPAGERPVEDLLIGDDVLTADGRTEQVRWIGSRCIDAAELGRNDSLFPVRIRGNAFGHDVPNGDLLVSPQHRIQVQDPLAEMLFGHPAVLAPAKGLLNDSTITVDRSVAEVEYFHLAFDQHEVIVTNGLATESFHPGPTSLDGIDRDAANELYEIFPGLKSNANEFGPSALPGLKPWEAALLSKSSKVA